MSNRGYTNTAKSGARAVPARRLQSELRARLARERPPRRKPDRRPKTTAEIELAPPTERPEPQSPVADETG